MLPPTELGLVDGRMGAPPARENALRAGDALDASENALISNRAQLSTAEHSWMSAARWRAASEQPAGVRHPGATCRAP
jgi:hypothetical protein